MNGQLSFLDDAERAKRDAIEGVEAKNPTFIDTAVIIIERLALKKDTITSLDVWALYDGPQPTHPRAIGAAFVRAMRAGLIVPTNEFIKSGRASDHNQMLRVWRVA